MEMWLIRKIVNWLLGEVEIAAEEIEAGDAVYKGEDGRWYKSKLQFDGFERNGS
jgi:hypothetical protein